MARGEAEVDRRPPARAPAKPKPPARSAPPQYTKVFGDALVRECERDERVVGITAAMNSGTGSRSCRRRCPTATSTSASPSSRPCSSRPACAAGRARSRRSTRRSCSARSTRSSTTSAYRPDSHVLHGPRRARRRRRPDAPWRVRHRLPAPAAEHHADGAARRGDARPHAPHRAAPRAGPSRSATRAARRSASAADCRERSRSARARSCARASAWRSSATAWRAPGAGRRRPAGRARPGRHRRRRPLREAARHRPDGPARGRARAARDRRGGRVRGRLRLGVWEALSDPARSRRGSCASACPDRYVTHGAPSSCTRRSASRPRRSPSASRPRPSRASARYAAGRPRRGRTSGAVGAVRGAGERERDRRAAATRRGVSSSGGL